MAENPKQRPGTERARDEQRTNRGPVYGGESEWGVADKRGDNRFGVARNDDSDPSELIGRAHGPDESAVQAQTNSPRNDEDIDRSLELDDEDLDDEDSEIADTRIESGGEAAGMSRGEKPRKAKRREKG